jgi:tyrosine-protein kinase Etk/Wzc
MSSNNPSVQPNTNETEESQGNLMETLLRDYVPYWPVIALALVLGLVAAKVYLRYQTNYYQVGTSILLKDESQSADNLLKQVAFQQNATFIDDEMEVIQGLGVMRGAARRLNAQVQIFTTGRVREEIRSIAVAPFEVILLKPDSIKRGQVAFDYNKETGLKIEGKSIPLNRTVNVLGNYVIFQQKDSKTVSDFDTTHLAGEVDTAGLKSSQYLVFRSLEDATGDVAGSVSLSKDKKTSVIKVNATVSNIEYGKLLLNAIVDSYQQETQDEKRKKARYTVDFIDSRLMYVGNDLDSVESKLENYKKQNNIQRLSKEAKLFLEKV